MPTVTRCSIRSVSVLENFDAIGRWRDKDEGSRIDSAGELPSGEAFSTPAGLKRILAKRETDLARNLAHNGSYIRQAFKDGIMQEKIVA